MKYRLIILLSIIGFATSVRGQSNAAVFEQLSHDFGIFSEDGDSPAHTFKFINKGTKAIAVSHVQTTCGCAVASYSHQPVRPGESGVITISYNPKGRPGKFARSALVSFSGSPGKIRLDIRGTVLPGAERKHKTYPYVVGDLQLKSMGLRFNPMRGKEQERSILIVNNGKTPLKLQFRSTDASLSGKTEPGILPPETAGEILILRKSASEGDLSAKCVRLKEDESLPKRKGYINIEVVTEKCP